MRKIKRKWENLLWKKLQVFNERPKYRQNKRQTKGGVGVGVGVGVGEIGRLWTLEALVIGRMGLNQKKKIKIKIKSK